MSAAAMARIVLYGQLCEAAMRRERDAGANLRVAAEAAGVAEWASAQAFAVAQAAEAARDAAVDGDPQDAAFYGLGGDR